MYRGELDEMSFVDKQLTCRDCGQTFTFTAGEQQFYAEKGFTNEPRRCPECRRRYKAQRDGQAAATSYATPPASRPERIMYPAICAQCGRETTVPFIPRQERPVYCYECFQALRGVQGYARY